MSESEKQNLAIPIAIVIAGALVAGAIFFMEKDRPLTGLPSAGNQAVIGIVAKNVPVVTATDHTRGDLSAPVKIVEYTDLECPFCKQFHGTMQQVLKDRPGKVAWVMRNFPLQQLHPNAPKLALAAECVASLAGNDAYWRFSDSIIAQAPINTFFDMTKLDATAAAAGADAKAFSDCLSNARFQSAIDSQIADATGAGGQGTPFSVIVLGAPLSNSQRNTLAKIGATLQPGTLLISADSTQIGLSGSQPIAIVESVIDALGR